MPACPITAATETSSIAATPTWIIIPTSSRCSRISAAEAVRYYKKTGIYPINHGMVVKRAVFERNPWVVINILKAFDQANDIADAERREHVAYYLETGLVPSDYRKPLATRIIKHGLKANRATLEHGGKIFQPPELDAPDHDHGRTVRGERAGFMKLRSGRPSALSLVGTALSP